MTINAQSLESNGDLSDITTEAVTVRVDPIADRVGTSGRNVAGNEDEAIAWRPVFRLRDRDDADPSDPSGAPGQEEVSSVSVYSNDPDIAGSTWKISLPGEPEQTLTIQSGSFNTGSGSATYQYKIDIPSDAIQIIDAAQDRFAIEGLTVTQAPMVTATFELSLVSQQKIRPTASATHA